MSVVFISWSKVRSHDLAHALLDLLQVQVGPYFTWSPDLPKGGSWFQNLAGELEGARAGIICITPENRDSPWLLFEAGALIRCDYEVALFPVLLDVAPTALDGPLSLIQSTVLERDATALVRETGALINRMVMAVNRYGVGMPFPTLPAPGAALDPAWQEYVDKVQQIESPSVSTLVPGFSDLFRRKTFREPFRDCADQRWLDRYAAARRAHETMTSARPRIDAALPPGTRRAYDSLSSAVDSYAMAIAGLLLEEKAFGRDTDGGLVDVQGALATCDARRRAIAETFERLDDPLPPVFDDARIYEELSGLEERKRRLIHPLQHALERMRRNHGAILDPPAWQRERARTSPWSYDRLVFYLCCAAEESAAALAALAKGVEFEISRLESLDQPDSLVVLYYALEGAWDLVGKGVVGALDPTLLERIDAAIERWNATARRDHAHEDARREATAPVVAGPVAGGERWDANRKVRNMVNRFRELPAPGARGTTRTPASTRTTRRKKKRAPARG